MKIESLEDMFLHTLKDIHYAESKILKALPKMIKAAQDEELKDALTAHLTETEGQIERLKKVFALLDQKPASEQCQAIDGILTEGEGMIEDTQGTPMRDLAIIASSQAVEHYEMVRYRSMVEFAGSLGMTEARDLLQETLDEEMATDEGLMDLSEASQASYMEEPADEKPAAPKRKRAS